MLRLGLLSTARINREILRSAASSERIAVAAVASRGTALAESYAREHGIPVAHGSYEALLGDAEIDAVYVPLPNGMHHEWTMRALGAGKHVLCEKPYSRHPAEVEEAFDLAERSGLVVEEAFMYRHHPQTHLVRELVETGAIGTLRAVHAAFTFRLDRLDDVRWRPDLDGGSLLDVGCYCVSGARLLAGEPVSVQAEQVVAESGVDLAFHGTLRFTGDVVAQIHSSFAVPRFQRLEAFGDDGALIVEAPWRTDWGGSLVIRRPDGEEFLARPDGDSFLLELEAFADAVEGRSSPRIARDDALGQARVIDALFRAAESGATVQL